MTDDDRDDISEKAEAGTVAEEACAGCGKPLDLCVCAAIDPVETRTTVLILQHPQEQDKELCTAGITVRQLRRGELRIGLSWPGLKRILGREVDHKRWAVLYLGAAKSLDPAITQEIVAVDKNGVALTDQSGSLDRIEGIIALDGNWSQAKALWWRNPWLLKLRRLVVNPRSRSRYGTLRREPRRESLATIEAVAMTLRALEGGPAADRLLAPFDLLLQRYRTARRRPSK